MKSQNCSRYDCEIVQHKTAYFKINVLVALLKVTVIMNVKGDTSTPSAHTYKWTLVGYFRLLKFHPILCAYLTIFLGVLNLNIIMSTPPLECLHCVICPPINIVCGGYTVFTFCVCNFCLLEESLLEFHQTLQTYSYIQTKK